MKTTTAMSKAMADILRGKPVEAAAIKKPASTGVNPRKGFSSMRNPEAGTGKTHHAIKNPNNMTEMKDV